GAGGALVGVVAHSDWPAPARALPRVGDAGALDLERIVALAPDLVIAWPYTAPPQLAALRAQNVTVFVSDPKTIAGIADDLEKLGTIGGTHLISQAISTCGGDNVFAALTLAAPSVTVEAVVAAAPDVIVGGDDAGKRPAWLNDWLRWKEIPAVRDGNLFAADGNLLHRSGPRFLDGVAALCGDFERVRARRKR
ncbi:MAG: ABC transporter substrate-binding protein, partial [Casimicrobiaceae bacterium]